MRKDGERKRIDLIPSLFLADSTSYASRGQSFQTCTSAMMVYAPSSYFSSYISTTRPWFAPSTSWHAFSTTRTSAARLASSFACIGFEIRSSLALPVAVSVMMTDCGATFSASLEWMPLHCLRKVEASPYIPMPKGRGFSAPSGKVWHIMEISEEIGNTSATATLISELFSANLLRPWFCEF